MDQAFSLQPTPQEGPAATRDTVTERGCKEKAPDLSAEGKTALRDHLGAGEKKDAPGTQAEGKAAHGARTEGPLGGGHSGGLGGDRVANPENRLDGAGTAWPVRHSGNRASEVAREFKRDAGEVLAATWDQLGDLGEKVNDDRLGLESRLRRGLGDDMEPKNFGCAFTLYLVCQSHQASAGTSSDADLDDAVRELGDVHARLMGHIGEALRAGGVAGLSHRLLPPFLLRKAKHALTAPGLSGEPAASDALKLELSAVRRELAPRVVGALVDTQSPGQFGDGSEELEGLYLGHT